jgi:F5/8 type C domain
LVLDGDPTTVWHAPAGPRGAYVQLDLGEVRPIAEIRWLVADPATAAGMLFQVSTDRRTWITLDAPAVPTDDGWMSLDSGGVDGRYVRFAFPPGDLGMTVGGLAEVEVRP